MTRGTPQDCLLGLRQARQAKPVIFKDYARPGRSHRLIGRALTHRLEGDAIDSIGSDGAPSDATFPCIQDNDLRFASRERSGK